jgi:hypothetical protein
MGFGSFWLLAGCFVFTALFLLVSAIYGNIVGGPGAPAMVFYALLFCLTALLLRTGICGLQQQ